MDQTVLDWLLEDINPEVRLTTLKELYAMDDCTGYLGFSFLDGRLTKRDAVKILRIL